MKKNIKENEKSISSFDHKKSEYNKSIQNNKESLEKYCKDLGIEVSDYHETTIYRAIKSLIKELPDLMEEISESLSDEKLIECTKYYSEFTSYIEQNNKNIDPEELLPELYHFIKLPKDFSCIQIPNFSVNAIIPENQAEINWDIDNVDDTNNTGDINWDIDIGDDNKNDSNEINWDIDIGGDNNNEINWDIEDNTQVEGTNNNNNVEAENWDIKIEESGDITVETCGTYLFLIYIKSNLINIVFY